MLKVKLLNENATAPTVGHPGEDVAYDLYASENVMIPPQSMRKIKTGISIEFVPKAGAIIKCRSGMASQQASVEGGVIDAGYRGEMMVMLRNHDTSAWMGIKKGMKIAQMVEHRLMAGEVLVVEELSDSERGSKGFGSTGK